MYKLLLFVFTLLFWQQVLSQKIEILSQESNESFRGLSVVNDSIIWISGTNGTVGRSIDAGQSFQWLQVKGFEQTDFRDIEAFDEHTAIIMGIAEPAYILKTTDAGLNWNVVYKNQTQGMFLDALDFFDDQNGMVIGDPINGKVFLAQTHNGGDSWTQMKTASFPDLVNGEACFASSGSNLVMLSKKKFAFITGGVQSHLFIGKKRFNLPILMGKETTGANAIGAKDTQTLLIVGGDFMEPDLISNNIGITHNAGKSFIKPIEPPHGYRSCVVFMEDQVWISCGINGVDISNDNGLHWQLISTEGFHVCKKAKQGHALYFAGKGKIGVYRE
jgi:photosystem II stability/assembly factor-like uncharacterized protein